MRGCHVFALPSYGEGMPKALLEAWAAGLAVVTTPVGAIPDLLNHGTEGLLHSPGAILDLAAALTSLAVDEQHRRELATAGLTKVHSYTWTIEIERIASRLKAVATQAPKTVKI